MTLINAWALLSIKTVLFTNLKVSKGYLALQLPVSGVELCVRQNAACGWTCWLDRLYNIDHHFEAEYLNSTFKKDLKVNLMYTQQSFWLVQLKWYPGRTRHTPLCIKKKSCISVAFSWMFTDLTCEKRFLSGMAFSICKVTTRLTATRTTL